MAIRVIDDSKLNDIAVAIQAKDSGGQMTVDEMPTRIANIPSGGGTLIPKTITENGVYNASSDNADGYDIVTVDVDQQRLLDDYLSMAIETVSSDITFLRGRAFSSDTTIKNVSFPLCASCGERPFVSASNIETINMPKLNTIVDYFASYCFLLHTVNFDSATKVGSYAFALNYNGAPEQDIVFSFPNLSNIKTAAFQYRNKVIVILGSICQLSDVNAFSNKAKIYAHQADIDNYYSIATNWSVLYANGQIYPIEGSEYE